MNSEEFGQAATDVILSTLRIYIEASHLMRDLRTDLQEGTWRVFPLASISDGNPALKTLKGWRGFLAAPELYEPRKKGKSAAQDIEPDEDEGEKGPGRILTIRSGKSVLFAKLLLHDYPRRLTPCFLGGILSGATTTGGATPAGKELRFNSEHARKILERLTPATWSPGGVEVPTDAKIQIDPAAFKGKKKRVPKLHFELRQEPILKSLWELDGTDTVQRLADALREQWRAAEDK